MPTTLIDPSESPAAFFASELRRFREASGYSQKELGSKIGYSEQAVCMVELAKRTPTEAFAKGCDTALATNGALMRLWPLVKKASVQRWFQEYVDLEARAVSIHSWDPRTYPACFRLRPIPTSSSPRTVEAIPTHSWPRAWHVRTPCWSQADHSSGR